MIRPLTEPEVQEVALAWLEWAGWQLRDGAEIAPGELRVKEVDRAIKRANL